MRRLISAVLLLFTAGLAPALAQSQAANGTIEGTIVDSSAALLPGVTVVVHNVETGAQRVVVTNASGVYRAVLLPLGTYRLTAELTGFKKYERTGITVGAGQTAVIGRAHV